MTRVLRRLFGAALTLLAVHAATFLLVRGARGGPFDAEVALPPAVQAELRARYQLDEPLLIQYGHALGDLLQGDFGPSLRYRGVMVADILADALPISLGLGAGALLLALLLGLPAGIAAAARAGRPTDLSVMAFATLGLALPNFVLAGLGILLFSFVLGWLPPAGHGTVSHWVLPILCLALPYAAQVARLTRAAALEVLDAQPHRAARARGLSDRQLYLGHTLPQASLPVVANLGPSAAGMLTGSLVLEQIFALPGLGAHFVQAALNRDYTLALGVTVTYTAILLLLTILADLLLERLDPRIRAVG